jgi:hypothetical protein
VRRSNPAFGGLDEGLNAEGVEQFFYRDSAKHHAETNPPRAAS